MDEKTVEITVKIPDYTYHVLEEAAEYGRTHGDKDVTKESIAANIIKYNISVFMENYKIYLDSDEEGNYIDSNLGVRLLNLTICIPNHTYYVLEETAKYGRTHGDKDVTKESIAVDIIKHGQSMFKENYYTYLDSECEENYTEIREKRSGE